MPEGPLTDSRRFSVSIATTFAETSSDSFFMKGSFAVQLIEARIPMNAKTIERFIFSFLLQ